MEKMRALTLLLAVLLPASAAAGGLSALFAEWKLEAPGFPAFEVKLDKQSGQAPSVVRELSATGKGGRYLLLTRVSNLEPAAAARYAATRRAEIETVYERHFDGYFPTTAKGHVCPEKMKPVRQSKKDKFTETDVIIYRASARRVPVCLKEEATQRAIAVIAYCPSRKEMYDLRYFQPASSYSDRDEKAIISISCATKP